MVKQRYCLVVDNSQALDTKGAFVELNFQPPIDLDMDKQYALTVTEVDITYINPNFVNGNVGFSYVYTTPSNLSTQVPQGYVMRSIYNATVASMTNSLFLASHETTYFNYIGLVSNGIAPTMNDGMGSIAGIITGSTLSGGFLNNLVNVCPTTPLTYLTDGMMTSLTLNQGATFTNSSGNAGVSLNYTVSWNSTVDIKMNTTDNSYTTMTNIPPWTAQTYILGTNNYTTFPLYFYYNVSTPCTFFFHFGATSTFHTSTSYYPPTNIPISVSAGAGMISVPLANNTLSVGTTAYFVVDIQSNSQNFTIYNAFFQIMPNYLLQTVPNSITYSTANITPALYFSVTNEDTINNQSNYVLVLGDNLAYLSFHTSVNYTTASPFICTIPYIVSFLPNAFKTINYLTFLLSVNYSGTIQFYLATDNTFNPTTAIPLVSNSYGFGTGASCYTVSFPTPQNVSSPTALTPLYLFVKMSVVLTTATNFQIVQASWACVHNSSSHWYDPNGVYPTGVRRLNSANSVVDQWTKYYNASTNVYNPTIIPITDTNGNPVVNSTTANRTMTVSQGFPTGLYDLDDLYLEMLNILQRDPAYTYNSSNTSSNTTTYPPFKLIGDASTEQIQIQIFDPNLFIELPVAGQYAQNNILYWLGFEPIIYGDDSGTPNLFLSTMAQQPLNNYLSVWSSSAYYYSTSGVIQYPASVQKMAGSYPTAVYSDTSARLNQLTAYYLNTDIATGTRVNGRAGNVIASITPVDTQVGMIFSYRPILPLQVHLTKYFIDQATFWITDQNGNFADFSNGGQNDSPESWSFRAFIEELD